MPSQFALFDSFNNLDQISAEAIGSWLKNPPQVNYLQNYLANKILYPETLPQTASDMQIELAILREALKVNTDYFLNIMLRKVLIPAKFLNCVPDLISLSWAFIDALLLHRKKDDFFQDVWTIVLTDDSDEVVGSLILPQFDVSNGSLEINVLGKKYQVRKGLTAVLPCPKDRCEIGYRLQHGQILDKTESTIEISGGRVGLLIDGRGL